MHNRNALKKRIFISLMSVSLLFSFTSVSLADEMSVSMSGMNMGGSSTAQTTTTEKNPQDSEVIQSFDANATSEHEAMPGMDPKMEGMKESSEHEETPGMDPEMEGMQESGAHGGSSESSVGVNWLVVGGFLGINALIIIIAGALKSSKKVQTQL